MVVPMHTRDHTCDVLAHKLTRALAPTKIEIEDESALHRGHKGASGGGHYRVFIVSAAFEGKSLVARHRMAYDAVAEEMTSSVHALALRTLTPAEEAAQRDGGAPDSTREGA
jgi:BolA protein